MIHNVILYNCRENSFFVYSSVIVVGNEIRTTSLFPERFKSYREAKIRAKFWNEVNALAENRRDVLIVRESVDTI